jgi:hypothetical protein
MTIGKPPELRVPNWFCLNDWHLVEILGAKSYKYGDSGQKYRNYSGSRP